MSKRPAENQSSDPSTLKKLQLSNVSSKAKQSENALHELLCLFPEEKFVKRVPRVVMKHMLYSLVTNRTLVDKEIDELQQNGMIRMFKLGGEHESLAVLFTSDFVPFIKRRCSDSKVIERFIDIILKNYNEVSIEKQALFQRGFTEDDIKFLIQQSLLTVRSVSSYWFSFPGAGEFMKSYIKGRQSVVNAVKKSKYKQILRTELEARKMAKNAPLGIVYHVHDIIGADLVSCLQTTSGLLLRIC